MTIPGNLLSQVTESVDPNTSGWTPLQNCTISLGTGGRNGDGCLAVRSSASGETRARTVSSYPVSPGVVYQTFADASSPTVVERIGIRWLTASNSEISITWSMTTSGLSGVWHRIGVADVAPTKAVRAQVVVAGMTPTASGVINFFENVYLGLPIHYVGNLLPYNMESPDQGITGWIAESNCTLSREAPVVSWAVGFYLASGHMLKLAVTANGNAAIRMATPSDATPGVEYVAACHLAPPTVSAASWIELRFYNAAGTQVQATRGPLAAPTTGVYRQMVAATAPPTAATCAVAIGIDGATAGQLLRAEQVAVMVAPVLQTGSVVPYADASFESSVAGWSKVSGVATMARSTPWGSAAFDGEYSLIVSSTTATTSVIRSDRYPITDGFVSEGWRVQWYSEVTAGGWTLVRGARFYDAAGTDLGLVASTSAAAPSPGWWRLGFNAFAPAGAAFAAVELSMTATSANSKCAIDGVSLWQDEPLITAQAQADTASITVTARDLTLDDFLRVSRVAEDGTRTLVRGPEGLYDGTVVITSDTMVIEDYEAPLAVPVTYFVEVLHVAGGSETMSSTSVTIPHTDANMAWLKDPGNPQRNMQVMVGSPAPDWQRPIDQATYVVQGRRNKVIRSGTRQGLEGDLLVFTQSDSERINLHWLLDSGNVLLWQAAPGMGVTDMYVSAGQITEARPGGRAQEPWRTWTLPLIEADMPVSVGINGSAGRTWQDILSEFDTWQDVLDAFDTWEDVLLNRRKAG